MATQMMATETPAHATATREEWLARRIELLAEEKEHTRRSDELARRRRELPWVRVDKEYRFDTERGSASLADLFDGRSQLLVYHFMFGPDYKAGCATCSMIADGFNGFAVHLAHHDVNLTVVSRAPLAKLLDYRQRMGWTFPWASAATTDFNRDFNVSFSEAEQRDGGIEYNYRREPALADGGWGRIQEGKGSGGTKVSTEVKELARLAREKKLDPKLGDGPVADNASMAGTDAATYTRERPGMSAFIKAGSEIYHTYSTYARGLDGLWGAYQWLDRAPLGRNETGMWWKRHDEYASR